VGYGDAEILGRSACLSLDLRAVCLREREGGRPERGASANTFAGSSQLKRCFHLMTVLRPTPSSFAISVAATPSAISSNACPRRTTRFSAVSGRSAVSTSARCASERGSGTVGRPTCGRFAHSDESSMQGLYPNRENVPGLLPSGTSSARQKFGHIPRGNVRRLRARLFALGEPAALWPANATAPAFRRAALGDRGGAPPRQGREARAAAWPGGAVHGRRRPSRGHREVGGRPSAHGLEVEEAL